MEEIFEQMKSDLEDFTKKGNEFIEKIEKAQEDLKFAEGYKPKFKKGDIIVSKKIMSVLKLTKLRTGNISSLVQTLRAVDSPRAVFLK